MTKSQLREDAIKALLGIILTDVPLIVTADLASTKQSLAEGNYSRSLVVIDGKSIEISTTFQILSLKEALPEIRIILLTENQTKIPFSGDFGLDDVLIGNISGNRFINSVEEVLTRTA